MSTNSSIRIKKGSKTIGIYCHWDGYLENNGNMLLEHYSNRRKINQLIALGDISSLRPKLRPRKNQIHNFDNPLEDVVVAYHRDRGEKLNQTKDNQEYNYLFDKGVWYWKRENSINWTILTKV